MVDLSNTGRTIYLCDKCGRQIRPDDPDLWWWLVSDKPLATRFMVRCPRHVTEWSMRQAGIPRTNSALLWLKRARESDTEDRPMHEFVHPYPMEGPWQ